MVQKFVLAPNRKIHRLGRRNKNVIEMQFDLLTKMDYYILRFFETRSRDLLAQS